jgi:hypothetical protein
MLVVKLFLIEAEDSVSQCSHLISQPNSHKRDSENPIPSAAVEEKSAIPPVSKDPSGETPNSDPPGSFYSVG